MLGPPVFVGFLQVDIVLIWLMKTHVGALLFWRLLIFVHQAEQTEKIFSSFFLLMACFLVGDSSALIMNKLKCPHCNYVAKYRRTLKRHLLIHTGVRSFSCDICGKLFTRREHVKRHSLVGSFSVYVSCVQCMCTNGVFIYVHHSVNKLGDDIYLLNNCLLLFLGICSIKKY